MKPLALVLLLAMLAVAAQAQQPAATENIDILVYFTNPDGWLILAQQQVPQKFTVRVYSRVEGVLTLKIIVNGKTVVEEDKHITFRYERQVEVKETAGSVFIYAAVVDARGFQYTASRSYTLTKKPSQLGPNVVVFGVKQFQEYILQRKIEVAFTSAVFAVLGLALAIIIRHVFMLVYPLNALNAVGWGLMAYTAYAVDPNIMLIYFGIGFATNLLSYYYIISPRVNKILVIDVGNTNVELVELPIYTAPDGKVAVALQSTKHAFDRVFRNRHVYLRIKGKHKVNWTFNGIVPLLIAKRAGELAKAVEKAEEGEKVRRYYDVELADIHDIRFILTWESFQEVKESYKEALEQLVRLKLLLPVYARELLDQKVSAFVETVKSKMEEVEELEEGTEGGAPG